MLAIQMIERPLSKQELADRVRQYYLQMEPAIKLATDSLSLLIPSVLLDPSSGRIVETVYTPEDQALIDKTNTYLKHYSEIVMRDLGLSSLATPPGDG